MKIVNIMGGLGNQMFQYAYAVTLREQNPQEEILIDTHHYKYNGYKIHQGFEIYKVFPNADIPEATARQVMKVNYYIPNFWLSRVVHKLFPKRKTEYHQDMHYRYYPEAATLPGNTYYDGYWQSYKYFEPFKQAVLKAYQHREPNDYNREMIAKFDSCNSIGMHVRRGDYQTSPQFAGICTLEYYQKAVKKMLEMVKNPKFFIFSDDIKWCQENIAPLIGDHEIEFVNGNRGENSYWDMLLMSHCKNLVIANSSFSWWGAFLNINGGVIISPEKWVNRDEIQETPVEHWLHV